MGLSGNEQNSKEATKSVKNERKVRTRLLLLRQRVEDDGAINEAEKLPNNERCAAGE